MPSLIIEKGPDRGTTVEIEGQGPFVFGRAPDCDFHTQDRSCSRKHFRVFRQDDAWRIKDLGSTHGTLLNGWRLDESILQDGDTVVAGETVLTFQSGAPEPQRGLLGKTIAGYQILERLGRGGMGTVYRARQIALDREVALKVLSARYSDDKTFINRFFKEAQAAARLNHPNVVQVYDVREEKGLYLISLEMMDGGTVQDLASAEGALPIPQVIRIARDAARGLVYAERKGIVHGDIKPDNLMLNSDGVVKISDLGLARDSGEVAHQGEEGIFGTPHFISPEQAQGRAVDSRSDIYSLGATVYRLITGETPFSGSSVREIVMKQIQEEPREIRELRPECPEDLADLVSVMMAKDPDDRFESAASLLEALEALDDSGRLAGKASTGRTVILGVIVLLLLGGGAFFAFREKSAPSPPPTDPNEKTDVPTPVENGDGAQKNLALERDLRVRKKLDEARRKELEITQEGKADDIPSLRELANLFLAAAAEAPEAPSAEDARTDAQRIEEKITKLEKKAREAEEAAARKRAAADAAFGKLDAEVKTLVAERRFAEAISRILAADEALRSSHRANDVKDLKAAVLASARDQAAKIIARAEAARDAHRFDEARESLKPLLERFAKNAGADPAYAPLKDIVGQARALGQSIDRAESDQHKADLARDRKRAFDALHEAYALLATSTDLAAARRKLDDGLQALVLPDYRQDLERARDDLVRVQSLFDALAAAVADPETKVTVGSGSRVLPSGVLLSMNSEGLVVRRRGGKEVRRSWKDVPPRAFYRQILARFADTPEQELGCGWFCLVTGLIDEARDLIQELKDAGLTGAAAQEFARLEKRLEREEEAATRVSRIRELYAKARSGEAPEEWFRIAELTGEFLEKDRGTRSFFLNSDGSTPWTAKE
ncbi:MAG TPA: FHA domain-containing protein [Planctomycetes bacterium]|nr:FHA domain-containing protein [Planctomycetota bacterium]